MAPHLVLAGCIEAIKKVLSSGHSVVALACKRHSRQYLDLVENINWRHSIHLCAGYIHKWDAAPKVQGNLLVALGCLLRDDGWWVHKVPVRGT